MQIVADENIPLADAFFSAFGEVRRLPGRTLSRADLGEAEALLVRSVTRVDRTLLAGTQVRFVGTCTIGTDHLDLRYLEEAGITWASAPGCNARGVVDYVLGCVLAMAEARGEDPATKRYGIVGAGQVGGRLLQVLRGLGWSVRVCDPPRQADEGGDFVPLERIVDECDVISIHTPLLRDGPWPTWHLFGEAELTRLQAGSWLINAARGEVVDNEALLRVLDQRQDLEVALDVWEGEPRVDPQLAAGCRIATPHIAGYSLDGKVRGTAMIHRAFCTHLGIEAGLDLQQWLPRPALNGLSLNAGAAPQEVLAMLCRAVYDPRRDDANFRRALQGDEADRGTAFDALRKGYPVRREIDGLAVDVIGEDAQLRGMLAALGIRS